jgi:hypothetical protein
MQFRLSVIEIWSYINVTLASEFQELSLQILCHFWISDGEQNLDFNEFSTNSQNSFSTFNWLQMKAFKVLKDVKDIQMVEVMTI